MLAHKTRALLGRIPPALHTGMHLAFAGGATSLLESGFLAATGTERLAAWSPILLRLAISYAILFGAAGFALTLFRGKLSPSTRLALCGSLASCVLAFHLSDSWLEASGWIGSATFLALAALGAALSFVLGNRLSRQPRLARSVQLLTLACALVVLAAPLPWSDSQSSAWQGEPEDQPANVIMVVIDTLRADHLGAWGYSPPGAPSGRSNSPWIDQMSQRGWRFDRAYAQAPWTRPSVASYMTGLFPQSHGIATQFDRLSQKVPTLASRLRDADYRTVGFSANPQVSPTFGLTNGFERFWNPASTFASQVALRAFRYEIVQPVLDLLPRSQPEASPTAAPKRGIANATADDLNREALAWAEQAPADRPTFLYLHYLDPHDPYNAPEDLLYGDPDSARLRDESFFHPHEGMTPRPLPGSRMQEVDEQTLADLRKRYDTEIRYVDDRIEQLITQLEAQGHYRPERDLFILTSDHGEEHYEHEQWLHGWSLFEEMIHVPLILHGPGLPRGEVHPHPVALVDLLPTIAEKLGLALDFPVHGESLLGDAALRSTRMIYSHRPRASHPIDMLLVEGQKLIRVTDGENPPVWMHFDLAKDPDEARELKEQGSAEFQGLQELLEEFRARAGELLRGSPTRVGLDGSMQESLQRLGYLNDKEGG